MRVGRLSGSSELSKTELRALAREQRDGLPAEARAAYGRVIWERVLAMEEFGRAETVLAYCSFGSEIDTSPLIGEILRRGKRLLLPRVDRASTCLEIYEVKDPETDLAPGVWGIAEPDPNRCVLRQPSEIQFAVIPGVAFDRRGGRVGFGKGYYDRLLAQCQAETVAAAFEAQIFERVPMERYDVAVGRVVTEREWS